MRGIKCHIGYRLAGDGDVRVAYALRANGLMIERSRGAVAPFPEHP